MSKVIVWGFYGEGRRDYGFLMPLVERILTVLLPDDDLLPIALDHLDFDGLSQIEKLKKAAQAAHGYHFLICHIDADGRDGDRARKERFEPGLNEIVQRPDTMNTDLVPLIPIKMTDAWMLIDFEAFAGVVGTHKSPSELGFPDNPAGVERIDDPKALFESAVRSSRPRRRFLPYHEVYKPLALRIRLERLEPITAYQQFRQHMEATLKKVNLLGP